MKNIAIKTQNSKAGTPLYKEKLGYSVTFIGHSEDRIVVDAFEGQGNSYKKREVMNIEIYDNGNLVFKGDKRELFEKLTTS